MTNGNKKKNEEKAPPVNTSAQYTEIQNKVDVSPLKHNVASPGKLGSDVHMREDIFEIVQNTKEKGVEKQDISVDKGQSSSSLDSLKDLLFVQMQFQPVVIPQLLQIPTHDGQVDLSKNYPLQKLQLGDILHTSARKDILEEHMKKNKLIEEAIKIIQEGLLEVLT